MNLRPSVARLFAAALAAWLLTTPARAATAPSSTNLDALAEQYVRLVLAAGEHDPNLVDAYYGPPKWREEARARKQSLEVLDANVRHLIDQVIAAQPSDPLSERRRRSLHEQLVSVQTRLGILRGQRLPFDEEARRIYGVSPPHHDDAYYLAIHRQLDAALPGPGSLGERMDAFKKKFIVPPDRVQASLRASVAACREATLAHVALPASENFELELVQDKPWGAYNWYQGDYKSLIQVNVSLPIYTGRMATLMCHEGYPGHHVLNTLLEERLVKARGWIEYTVYPLFSSMSLLAEGTADFGKTLVFPNDSQWQWERDTLYPIAGIDPSLAELNQRISQLTRLLDYAKIDAARAYLDGTRSGPETVAWLQEFTFATAKEAERSLSFVDTYRSYVVNYRLGEDLIQQHIDRVAGTDPNARWKAFIDLLSSPPIVSDLARGTTLDPDR